MTSKIILPMLLPVILHPNVIDFLHTDSQSNLKDSVWKCIDKLRQQQFDGGLRVKKLKGITKRVWEARVTRAIRLIFTYEKSRQPDTKKAQVYIAVQDICLEHDDVSKRAKARTRTPDAQWLDSEEIKIIGSLETNRVDLSHDEQSVIDEAEIEELHISENFTDELLSNIQWRVVESESDWQQAIMQQDVELPLKLTPEEYELVNLYGNLLLSGSAGTGKTTVGLYRLLKSLETLPAGIRLYVAYNPILVKEANEQFKRLVGTRINQVESWFQFKTIRDLCLEILQEAEKIYFESDEVNYQVFEQFYLRPERQHYPPALVWDEIRSLIKGSCLKTDVNLLSKREYEDLGKKKASVIPRNKRYLVYELAQWYQNRLKRDKCFDEIDLARQVLKYIKQGKGSRYQMIVCDEVQDLTQLQLHLLMQLVTPDGHLFFAGDLNQIVSPSGFRWEDLKTKFFKSHRQTVQKTLHFNFRSVGSLVQLANQLLKLRSRLLKEKIDEPDQSVSSYGECARLITAPLEIFKPTLEQLYPEDAILVRSEEDKERLSGEFQSSFVFTIEEAKGLEFNTVFLVEFFLPNQSLWKKALLGIPALKEKEIPQLRLELNLLYVAITRARRILNVWETQLSSIWTQEELASFIQQINPEFVREMRVEPTPQMWQERGLYYTEAKFYRQAIECFEKSGDVKLQWQSSAKLLLQERKYSEAVEFFIKLEDWQQAAQLFEKMKQWSQAANYWSKVGNTDKQQICEIYALESENKWEDAAQRWEIIGRLEEARRCWLKSSNKQKKAEIGAIEFEQKRQWKQAVKQYELARMPEKAAECKGKALEKTKQWEKAAEQYEIAGMSKKAKDCRNKIPVFSKQPEIHINGNHNKKLNKYASLTIANEINQHLCNIGIAFEGKDGKIRASKALVKDYIPGWRYDFTTKVAHRIEPEQNLKITLDFDEISSQEKIPAKYLMIQNLQREAKLYLEEKNMSMFKQTLAKLKQFQFYSQEADIYVNQGCQYGFENFDEAIKKFNLANWLNPYHVLAYYNRGFYCSRIGNYERAIQNFTISIDIYPGDSDVYVERGIAFLSYGKVKNAIKDFNLALTLNPKLIEAYLNLGSALSRIGNYEIAIQNFNKVVDLNSKDADAYYNRAFAYRQLEYYQEALNDYEKSAYLYKQQNNYSDFKDSLKHIDELRKIQNIKLDHK